jgi:hypothetical protein
VELAAQSIETNEIDLHPRGSENVLPFIRVYSRNSRFALGFQTTSK